MTLFSGVSATRNSVRTTIASLRKEFSSLAQGDSTGYTAFLHSFGNLSTFANSCRDYLDEETVQMMRDLAITVSVFSTSMVKLNMENEREVFQKYPEEVSIYLALEQDLSTELCHEEELATTQPAYIEPCARWLKDNCQNPYPSAKFRERISRETKSARKDIDAWFIDARRRIGWNDLRRKRFDNKRAKILQAASAFFNAELVPSDSEELTPQVEADFAAILGRATALYNEKFVQSNLATKLDVALKDLTPSLKEQPIHDKEKQRREEKKFKQSNKRGRDAYPTPERSPSGPIEELPFPPSLTDDSIPSAQLKRGNSEFLEDVPSPVLKRPRTQSIDSERKSEGVMPAPASTVGETAQRPSPSTESCTAPSSVTTTGKRKRRLSDGFQHPVAKRPQIRPQVVSDPLPSADWELWLHEHVLSSPDLTLSNAIPPPVSVEVPDTDAPLDIQLFNFPAVPEVTPSTSPPADDVNVPEPREVSGSRPGNNLSIDPNFAWLNCDFSQPLDHRSSINNAGGLSYTSSTTLATTRGSRAFDVEGDPGFLPDPFTWSFYHPALDFSILFSQPSVHPPAGCSRQVVESTSQTRSTAALSELEQQVEAKKRELEELEARAKAIRAGTNA